MFRKLSQKVQGRKSSQKSSAGPQVAAGAAVPYHEHKVDDDRSQSDDIIDSTSDVSDLVMNVTKPNAQNNPKLKHR